jgi:hypothetical protein
MATIVVSEDRISKLENSNGIIFARLEETVVKQRLSRDIYSNANSGFRELYANEVRACHRALALKPDMKSPRIMITIDYSNRNLVIHGVNSLGIPLLRFKEVVAVLGESDNDSGNETGQFGLGLNSFLALSDNILFECFSLESGEKYSYLGDGEKYERLPEPSLDSSGTRVTVTLRESVDMGKLESYVRTVCLYSSVDTFLTVLDEDGNSIRELETLNTCNNLGDAISSSYGIPIEVNDEDFYLRGILAPRISEGRPLPTILLLRIPIQAKRVANSLTLFYSFIVNIKDERKYKPAVDRERLKDDAQQALVHKINQRLEESLPKALDLKTLDDFRNSACHDFYYASGETTLYKPAKETQEISNIINYQVKRNGDGKNSVKLGELVMQSKNLFLSTSVEKGYEHVLRKEYDDAIVFKPAFRHNLDSYSRELFRKYGIRTDTEQEFQRIKTKLGRGWREGLDSEPRAETDAPYYITVHQSRVVSEERYGNTTHYLSERADSEFRTSWIDEKVIFIPGGELSKYLNILKEVDCSYKLTKANPKKMTGTLTLEKFVEKIGTKETETIDGKRMSFKEIIKSGKRLEVLVYDDPSLSGERKLDEKTIFLAMDQDNAFEIAVLCTYFGVDYRIKSTIPEDEFFKATGKSRSSFFSKERVTGSGREESYEPDAMFVANCAYHVALGIRDKGLVQLYLSAMEGNSNGNKAREYRDFLFALQNE